MPTLGEIVARFGGELTGDSGTVVEGFAPLERAGPGELAFLSNPRLRDRLTQSRAAAVIMAPPGDPGRPAILTPDPYLYFALVAGWLAPAAEGSPGIHPSAVVDGTVAPDAHIGANVYIGTGATIGARANIAANAVIHAGAAIGEDTRIYSGVAVHEGCKVGRRCVLHANAVIGADGFGFARHRDGRWQKIPQVGRVVLGDDVEVGAGTCIDRGAMDDTIIGDGVKLDNLIQIAHNVCIGKHTAIAGCTGIAGSTVIGERCTIGGAAIIVGHIEIGDDVHIGAGAVIAKSVPRAGRYSGVVPSMEHQAWLKNYAHLRHLDAMADKIRRLEQRLSDLEKKK